MTMDGIHPYHAKIQEFFKSGRRFVYKKGEIIIHAGDTPQGVYCIEQGFVKVYSLSKEGEENIHTIYKTGELFPLLWTFRGIARNVYYESLAGATLWRVSREDFLTFAKTSSKVFMSLLDHVAEQLYAYADRLENLEYNNAYERVVYCLLLLASRFGVKHGNTIIIDVPLNHQEIADLINLARETASRLIEKLEDKNLISQKKHRIVIEDLEKLAHALGDSANLELWGLKP